MKSVSQAMRQPEVGPNFGSAVRKPINSFLTTIEENRASGKAFGAFRTRGLPRYEYVADYRRP
jgi:hypothetical protein